MGYPALLAVIAQALFGFIGQKSSPKNFKKGRFCWAEATTINERS